MNLLRCNNCFIVRSEKKERLCPICGTGILKITPTPYRVDDIELSRLQELLKHLMKTTVSPAQLAAEVPTKIDEAAIVEDTIRTLNFYLFCGQSTSVPLPLHIQNELTSIVGDYVTDFIRLIESVAEEVSFADTIAVIRYIKIKSLASSSIEMANEIVQLVKAKLNLKVTGDLVRCNRCFTLYRSFGFSSCFLCGEEKVKVISDFVKSSYHSGSQILTWLIQSGQENNFTDFSDTLLAFILTFHLSKMNYDEETINDLKERIQIIQQNSASLLQFHAAIYDLMESLKPLVRRRPNTMYDPSAEVFEEFDNNRAKRASLYVGSEEAPPPKPEQDKSLSASLFTPVSVPVSESFLVQVFVHEAHLVAEANAMATSGDGDTVRRFQTALNIDSGLPHQLDISLVSADVELDERNQSLKWNGGIGAVQFIATVPKTCTKSAIFCTIIIAVNSVPVGEMKCKIKIAADAGAMPLPGELAPPIAFEKYERVFISYASEDRVEVLKRVQILKALKIDFFQDILSLEPGDNWQQMLYHRISVSDAFFLFWSSAAAQSSWVRKEIICALNIKRGREENPPHIIPVIIEGPPPPAPPEELSFLHFNDKLLYLINQPAVSV